MKRRIVFDVGDVVSDVDRRALRAPRFSGEHPWIVWRWDAGGWVWTHVVDGDDQAWACLGEARAAFPYAVICLTYRRGPCESGPKVRAVAMVVPRGAS